VRNGVTVGPHAEGLMARFKAIGLPTYVILRPKSAAAAPTTAGSTGGTP